MGVGQGVYLGLRLGGGRWRAGVLRSLCCALIVLRMAGRARRCGMRARGFAQSCPTGVGAGGSAARHRASGAGRSGLIGLQSSRAGTEKLKIVGKAPASPAKVCHAVRKQVTDRAILTITCFLIGWRDTP